MAVPAGGPAAQVPLALCNGAGFAGAVTVANLLIVERRPRAEWNRRLAWLETSLSVGQAALLLAAWLSGMFVVAGRFSQRRGPAAALAGALASRVVLLTALAVLDGVGHTGAALPLLAFAGIMFAWSFLSVAPPALTGQLAPDNEGDAQGLLSAASGLAGLAGSVVGGLAASQWGYPAAVGIGAAAVAAGLVVFVLKVMRSTAQAAGGTASGARAQPTSPG